MIKLLCNKKEMVFASAEWSGSENQCSRQLVFSLPSNPYDKEAAGEKIALGSLVHLYDGAKQLFVGTVTAREKPAAPGTATYTALDFMHHLLRSNGTYKFRKKTPEKIIKKLCGDLQIGIDSLPKMNVVIPKLYFNDQCFYDMMVTALRKAKAKTGKKYMPVMKGNKVAVIEKGKSSGVVLAQGANVTDAAYSDSTDDIVNRVRIYDDKMRKKGQVRNRKNESRYGIYQQTYTKEKGVSAKKEAKAMLMGVTKTASIEAPGDTRAVSGFSIQINEKAAGLTGKFYIANDTHTFQDGVHTMQLELAWRNVMEDGAEVEKPDDKKKKVTNAAKCFYLEDSRVYHSSGECPACKGKKNLRKSTVGKMKKIKLKSGKNKGKRKYKPCSKCWET